MTAQRKFTDAKMLPEHVQALSARWAIRRGSSWRRHGPKAVTVKPPVKMTSVALDAVAVALGLGVGLAIVAALTIVSAF